MSDLRAAVEGLQRGTICRCGLAQSYHGRLAEHDYEPRFDPLTWAEALRAVLAIIDAHQCLPSEGAVPTDVVDISSQCLPSEEDLAALITESTTKLLNDRATIGYHDDIRPYIRLRNYLLANLRERG